MTTFNKKAFKGLPTGIKVRKPRYYYQDFVETYTENSTKDITLTEFEGLDYELSYSTLTFTDKKLWNNEDYNGSIRALAPYSDGDRIEYNLTTVGYPSIKNGVASGFSGSDYVTIDTPNLGGVDTWEIFAKITTGSDVTSPQYLYQFSKATDSDGRFGETFFINTGTVFTNLTFTGSTWASDSDYTSVVNNNYTIEPNTTYYTKFSFDGNCYRLEISKNNIDWDIALEKYTTTKVYSGLAYTRLGSYNNEINYFKGSIDLNESYIKLDDEVFWQLEESIVPNVPEYLTTKKGLKYNVVGYPIVVDGVASGFSGSNYIQIPKAFKPANESWEFVFKVTTPSSFTQQRFFGSVGSYYKTIGGEFNADGKFGIGITSNGSTWDVCWMWTTNVLQVNTNYWIKVSFTGTQYKLELSTDGVEYTLENSKDSTAILYQTNDSIINIGYMGTTTSAYFQGSVDLNECYIKIGSEYFWGKNAKNVISVAGCLDDGLYENYNETTYNAFVKGNNVLLTDKEDVEGMVWANKIIIPEHLKSAIYEPNYNVVGNISYDIGYNVSGFNKGTVIYSPVIEANTTDETLCYIFKVKPGKVESTWRILMGNKGGLNHLVGVGDGKWFLWNISTPAEGGTYEFGSSYWVAVMVYPDQTIVYYMKDDGTFSDVSKLPLPVIRGTTQPYWSIGPTMNANMFVNTAKWIGAGNDSSDQYWTGSVDLKNTIIYKNHNNFMVNTEIIWQPLLTVSEQDKFPDKEWM